MSQLILPGYRIQGTMIINHCNSTIKSLLYICLTAVLLLFILPGFTTALSAATDSAILTSKSDFPTYPAIRPNVGFWMDMFTKYSKSHGVIHDSRNLGIIYDIITLDDSYTLSARRKNRKRKKEVIGKYKNMLLNLSKGQKSILNREEKRVEELFPADTKPADFKNAAYRIRCQTGLNKEFKKGLERSGAVIDKFRQIFLSHGLPVDLVYLPCVESSYNFRAYSKFGAAGIWQFTRSTGRRYMEIGYVVDERRDPYISTDAAARLLKTNYASLKNWPMAITAYNHGLAGMKRAKRSKGSYEKIVKYYRSRTFKFASRNFYSEFLAARKVAKNPEKYFSGMKYHKPADFQTVQTRGFLNVQHLSDTLNIKIEKLKILNPALRKPVFNGQKYIPEGYNLRLPKNLPVKNFNNHISALYKHKQKPSRFHRVQKGDTAGSIARIHSVNLHDLTLANSLDRRATIYIGQNLRIPVNNGLQVKNEKPINLSIVTANLNVVKTFSANSKLFGIIKVETEETLGHYADWLQIPIQKIRDLNNLSFGKSISIDQKIKIPLQTKSVQEFEEQRYEYHKEIEEDFFESFVVKGIETYEVKNGDNIWNLCLNRLEIPFWLLKKYNPGINFSALHPLQKLRYPIVMKSI